MRSVALHAHETPEKAPKDSGKTKISDIPSLSFLNLWVSCLEVLGLKPGKFVGRGFSLAWRGETQPASYEAFTSDHRIGRARWGEGKSRKGKGKRVLQQAQFIPVSGRLLAEATQPVDPQNFCLLPFTFCLLVLLFAHMHMCETGSLQSLWPVLPPMARTDIV